MGERRRDERGNDKKVTDKKREALQIDKALVYKYALVKQTSSCNGNKYLQSSTQVSTHKIHRFQPRTQEGTPPKPTYSQQPALGLLTYGPKDPPLAFPYLATHPRRVRFSRNVFPTGAQSQVVSATRAKNPSPCRSHLVKYRATLASSRLRAMGGQTSD